MKRPFLSGVVFFCPKSRESTHSVIVVLILLCFELDMSSNNYLYSVRQLRQISLIAFFFALSQLVYAGGVKKGYQALAKYDYFSSKKYFTKSLKYNESAGAQGLAIIYLRDDNPFHDMDSAYRYVNMSIEGFDMVKSRKKEKWAIYGFTKDSLLSLRQAITTEFYRRARKDNTVEAYATFIERHPWAKEMNEAIAVRDSLAFFEAVQLNTSESYNAFMSTYPNSFYAPLAKENYFDSQYIELTEKGTLDSFLMFIREHPTSPLVKEAQKQVFEIETKPNTTHVFRSFIEKYPENPYVDSAWWNWYQLALLDYKVEVMDFFLDSTDAPFKDWILEDKRLMDSTFLPFDSQGGFGYMNCEGRLVIQPVFEFSSFFQEGLAIVVRNGKYGYINKRGQLQIPCVYESASDFVDGLAIVEVDEHFGMIDRNGNYILECMFENLGMLSEGLAYAQIDDLYGYYNRFGQMAIAHLFEDAYDFHNGEAKVVLEEKQGLILPSGEFSLAPIHETIFPYSDSLFIYGDDGLYGVMNHQSQVVVEAKYESINPLSEGLALAAIDGRIVYLDPAGVVVIDNGLSAFPNYQRKAEFKDGVAVAMKKGKYGRIDAKGKILTEFTFTNIGIGKDYFPAEKDGYWGVYNSKGKVLVSPKYDALSETNNGLLIANLADTLGVIDANGNIVVPIAFNEVEILAHDLFLVQENGLKGVYRNEELVLPVQYEQVGVFNEEFLFLNKGGVLSYYDLTRDDLVVVKE